MLRIKLPFGKVLKVGLLGAVVALIKRRKVATKSNFGGKDDVNKILTEPFFWDMCFTRCKVEGVECV